MSFLDKLHRNDNALDVRPEAELKKLFGRKKGKGKEREQAEQQDNSAADQLVNVALSGNPINAAAKAIVGGADPIAPLTKKANELAAPITDKVNDITGTVNEVAGTVAATTAMAKDPVAAVLEHAGTGTSTIVDNLDVATNRADKAVERGNEVRHTALEVVDKTTEAATTEAGTEQGQKKKKGGLFGRLTEQVTDQLTDKVSPQLHANIAGFDTNLDTKAALDDKNPVLGGGITVDGNVLGKQVHAEASTDNALDKNAKVDARADVDGKPVTLDAKTDTKPDAKVDAKTEAGDARQEIAVDGAQADAKGKLLEGDAKTGAKLDGGTKADGQADAATPAERMAKVAVDNAERETKGEGGVAGPGGGGPTVADPGTAPAGGKAAKGLVAQPADAVQAQIADKIVDVPVVSKPNTKLGPGGKSIATATSRAAKNVVGRWGHNLDALDIGPDPENVLDVDAPAPPDEPGADPIEVGIPGVTLPKLTPRGPRPKISAKLGHGDWHASQSKGVQTATQTIESRTSAATDHGDQLAHGSGSMAKSHVDHDAETASSLTAVANKPPQLVQKRGGGRKPQPAKPKQVEPTTTADGKDKQPGADKQPDAKKTPLDVIGDTIDGVVDAVKAAAPDIAGGLADTFTKAIDPAGGLSGNKLIKTAADTGTRALAAMKGVPADQKSNVLGRLDAVTAVGSEKAHQFVDHVQQNALDTAGERSTDADAVGRDEGGKRKKGDLLDGGTALGPVTAVADSYLQHHSRDNQSLRRIQEQAFADLDTTVGQPKPDFRDPLVWDAIGEGREHTSMNVADERPQLQPQMQVQPQMQIPQGGPQQQKPNPQPQQEPQQAPTSGPAQNNAQQTAARAQQQAQGVQAQHGAKTQQHAQHARNREQEAKQRAEGRKKQAEADKKAREAALEKEAPAQKEKMKAELTSHKNLALQVLSMNKEQLQAEYDRRLKDDVKALQDEIKKSKEDVTKSWADQKPKAQAANTKAKVDIDKFCNAELKTIDGQLKTLSAQLKTNPEKAAKTAEEQGKDDCDRYADTRDGNIERIRASAKDAADEQRRLGAEAYRIGLARAERQTDQATKDKAKGDAEAQKSHFEAQANKCVSDGETKAATEKKKYDDLIAKRTESYKTTARNIREKGVGYLEELKASFEQAKRDIEKLREDSKKQADAQLAHDILFIDTEIRDEMRRLELKLEDRERELRTEIKYALASMANLTEDQKTKMRADIEKAHKEACARIDEAKANELNAMQLQLADCHSRIDQALGPIGSHTVKAVRQLASFRQEFGEQVEGTVGSIKARADQAERAQAQIAQTAATTSAKLRSGAMDSVSGMNAEQLGKRDQLSDFNAQQDAFKKQQEADIKRFNERNNEINNTLGNANHKKVVDQKLDAARREMGNAVGGYGINPDMSKVMQEMAKLSPEELEQLFKGPQGEALKARLAELSKPGWVMPATISPTDIKRIEEMQKAGTPEQVKAQVIDWCFNGGFTGMGYDDKTFKEVMKGMSPEERAEVDKNFKARTGRTISQEIDDEAWFSSQNNRLMNAHAKSDAAAIAEEKWQAAEGGFFRGVKDMVDSVPGGRFLTDPGGEMMRGVGPLFGFKAPDHPLDTLAGYGMNQDEYIKQTDRIRELTEPPPGASPAEVSAYLQKRRDMMREIDQWLGANHSGLTLEKMDNSEANSDYNRFWMKNNDASTFRNMLDAGRTGDWAKYSNNKAAYGVETTLGNRAWLKQEIEYRQGRGDLKGLREFLGTRSEDGKFESFIDQNIPQAVDRGYFKAIAEDPPPERGTPKWRELMANKLLYAQFGGRTGWGDDRAEMEKVIQSMSKEELDALRADYTKLSGQYGLTMDNDANKVGALTNPVGFFFLGNWSTGKLDSDMYLSYGGYMHDITGGVIGKGEDYAMMEYDLKNGKPQTPEQIRARAKYKHDFNTSSGLFNTLREKGIYDSRGWMGKFADAEYEKFEASYQRLKALGVADLPLTDPRVLALAPDQLAEVAQFQYQLGEAEAWNKSANANTRMMVDGIVTVVTTTVTIITTAAITILTAGTATPFLVAALMAAGGAAMAGLAGMGVKVVLLGNAYGGNEAKMDFANLVIDSLVAGVTAGQGISNFAGKIVGKLGISQKIAQEVLTELIQNAINSGADLTKFLLDESLYQGSPEEVLAKLRKKSLQLGASTVLSTGAGVTKYNGAWLQTTIQSAVTYDPDQPAWGQFLNYASSMATAVGTEAATKWGTRKSQSRWGEGGVFGPNKGAGDGADSDSGDGSSRTSGGVSGTRPEAQLPSNGMRTRPDGTIEVSSPELARGIREQAANGQAKLIEGTSPPRYRVDTANGPIEVELKDGVVVPPKKQNTGTEETPVDGQQTKPPKPNQGDDGPVIQPDRIINVDDQSATGTPKKVNEPKTEAQQAVDDAFVQRRIEKILKESPGIDPAIARKRAIDEVGSFHGPGRAASQDAAGHAQIEVHSHFMGNVEVDTILRRLQEAGVAQGSGDKVQAMRKPDPDGLTVGDRVGDQSPYEPLLREIMLLKNRRNDNGELAFSHEYEPTRDAAKHMAGQKYEIDPKTGQPVIHKRGVAGDALHHVETVLARIELYKEMMLDPKLSPADKKYIADCIHEEAMSAANKALRASNETDFNSSYEIRDELLKKFYGDAERQRIVGDAANQPYSAQADKLREHFATRPSAKKKVDVAEAADAKVAAFKEEAAKKLADASNLPQKDRQKLREELAHKLKELKDAAQRAKDAVDEQIAYDTYAKDTLLRLAQDDIRYTEQSNSLNKMQKRFDPEQLAHLKAQLAQEYPHLAEKIWNVEVKHLAMITTNHFGDRDGNVSQKDQRKPWRSDDQSFDNMVDGLLEQVRRGDTVGVDIAGAEHFSFDEKGAQRLQYLYVRLMNEAVSSGKRLVLRPHVGEGANDPSHGDHFNRDGNRQMVNGELSHVKRARENVDQLVAAFEQLAKVVGKPLPDNVVVRFGHATHTTPEAARKMAELGIIAEVNLASNVQSGATPQTQPKDGKHDQQRGKKEVLDPHDPTLRGHGDMEQHALVTLIAAGVPVILSTDAHAVMSTDMKDQVKRAQKIVDLVLADERLIEIANPDGTTSLKVFSEITDPAIRKRFTDAKQKFIDDANHYYDQRRGGQDTGEGPHRLFPKPKKPGGPDGDGGATSEGGETTPLATKQRQQRRVDELVAQLKGDDKMLAKAAFKDLEHLAQHPDWHQIIRDRAGDNLFDWAKYLQGVKGKNPATDAMSSDLQALLDQQALARRGRDVDLQNKRESFERAVALELLRGGELTEAINGEMDRMSKFVIEYLKATRGDDWMTAVGELGTDVNKGYGGGIGKDPQLMLEILQNGNIRERMLALGAFTELIANDSLNKHRRAKLDDMAANGSSEAERVVARARAYEAAQRDPELRNAKDFLKPIGSEKKTGGKHEAYARAKAQDMDTKLPALVAEKVAEFMGLTEKGKGLEKKGEENRLARTGRMTVEEAIQKGLNLSQREIDAAGGLDAPLNWVIGMRANIVDANAPFIADARERSMPLKAGISGTTFRWMQTVELLGGNPALGRLAAVASLQAADAHSWHEIAFASQGYGNGALTYDPAKPYENMGIPRDVLEKIAQRAGVSLEELQGAQSRAPQVADSADKSDKQSS